MNGVIPGKPDPPQAPKTTGLMLATIVLQAMPCMVERGCAGLEHSYGRPAGTVEWQGDQEWLSMEMAEPKYPTVTTLGNNKGLSLAGVECSLLGTTEHPSFTTCVMSHHLQGDAGGLWV